MTNATEALDKLTSKKKSNNTAEQNPVRASNVKCTDENKDKCKRSKCDFYHPIETCQQYSKHGYCPNELNCNRRHPIRLCYEYRSRNSCRREESCRFRHPFELSIAEKVPNLTLF